MKSTSGFYKLLSQKFPQKKMQQKVLEKIIATVALGMRALVVKNLDPRDKEAFEQVVEKEDDLGIFLFAQEKVDNFENHFQQLVDDIAQTVSADLTS